MANSYGTVIGGSGTNGNKPGSAASRTIIDDKLTPAQRKQLLGTPAANLFTPDDRLYRDYTDFATVYEWPDIDLREMRDMLTKDGNPRKLEQVLTLPIRGAAWEIRGNGPEAELARTNLGPLLPKIIDQAMSAVAYRKAFFEVTWKLEGGQILYDEVAPRPAVCCEAAFDQDTGKPIGFRQQLAPITQISDRALASMGWVRIAANRSWIFTYGAYREPLRGVSDLDVSLYCWSNIRKLQFLWFQYLETTALPRVLVYGDDDEEADRNAGMIADAKGSATIPVVRRNDPAQHVFDVLESSGHGHAGFEAAIGYLEGKQTQSVLASFMDLAQHASVGGAGSNALSADQSEFFLASRQAVADELAEQIVEGLIRPLIVYNYGPDADIPEMHIGPIGNRQVDRALGLLSSILTAQNPTAPPRFTASLMTHVATFLGLETDEVKGAADEWTTQQQDAQKVTAEMQKTALDTAKNPPPPAGHVMGPDGQPIAPHNPGAPGTPAPVAQPGAQAALPGMDKLKPQKVVAPPTAPAKAGAVTPPNRRGRGK
jgi:hypothetical protein